MAKSIFTIMLTFSILILTIQAAASCSDFVKSIRDDTKIHDELQNMEKSKIDQFKTDLDCLETMIRTNSFKSAKILLNKQFGGEEKDPKVLNKA